MTFGTITTAIAGLLSVGGLVASGGATIKAPAEVFSDVFNVFLGLGTLVFLVVTFYMVYNAYKYRHGSKHSEKVPDEDRPSLGEVPTGGGGGKKLALSFTLSAIIVVSLIVWTYGLLIHVETGAAKTDAADKIVIDVEGYQFGWDFVYPNGHTATNTLRVPRGTVIELLVTSRDVFHTLGSPDLRFKADAIPGQYTDTWFVADQTGAYKAQCYELCGAGHSFMEATVVVMEPEAYQDWYASTNATANQTSSGAGNQSAPSNSQAIGVKPGVAL